MTTDQLNQNPTQPGYTVQVSYPAQPKRNKSFTFRDSDLLNARQVALQKAQQIVTEKQAHEVIDVTVDLVEIDRTSAAGKHKVIARVFQQRFHRTLFMAEGKDLLKEASLSPLAKKSLPPSLFVAMDLEKDEAGNSLDSVLTGLTELENECGYYYANGYSTGFGSVQLNSNPENADTVRSYVMLYDGFPFAASLVSKYNQQTTDESQTIGFNLQFLPPDYAELETR